MKTKVIVQDVPAARLVPQALVVTEKGAVGGVATVIDDAACDPTLVRVTGSEVDPPAEMLPKFPALAVRIAMLIPVPVIVVEVCWDWPAV